VTNGEWERGKTSARKGVRKGGGDILMGNTILNQSSNVEN